MTEIRTARLSWIYFTIFVATAVVLEVLSFVLSRSRTFEILEDMVVFFALQALSVLLALFALIFGVVTCVRNRNYLSILWILMVVIVSEGGTFYLLKGGGHALSF